MQTIDYVRVLVMTTERRVLIVRFHLPVTLECLMTFLGRTVEVKWIYGRKVATSLLLPSWVDIWLGLLSTLTSMVVQLSS